MHILHHNPKSSTTCNNKCSYVYSRCVSRMFVLLFCVILSSSNIGMTNAEDTTTATTDTATATSTVTDESNGTDESNMKGGESSTTSTKQGKIEFPEEKWGTYYDPQNIFCGKYDCYKILGFDYESWGRAPPSKKELTQSYRTMSKQWHPDKNRDKGAKDRFVKINKAYEVLTNKTLRKEYDYMRERPDEYFNKYGSPTIYKYAPKSDTVLVILIILIGLNAFSWFAQKQRWQQIANRVVKDAVEGGGESGKISSESIELRDKAEIMLKEKKEASFNVNSSNDADKNDDDVNSKKKAKSKVKLTKKEMKQKENEELRPLIEELVKDIKDFGAGFHQPTWRDLLIVRMIRWPEYVVKGILWQSKYLFRRLRKLELNDEERQVLTKRAVGPLAWEAATDEDKEEMISRDLWVMENLELWLEDQEIRQFSKGQQKRINRVKKMDRAKGNKND